jgi:hypothetical protein
MKKYTLQRNFSRKKQPDRFHNEICRAIDTYFHLNEQTQNGIESGKNHAPNDIPFPIIKFEFCFFTLFFYFQDHKKRWVIDIQAFSIIMID